MDPNLFNATIAAPAAAPNTLGASQYATAANAGAIDRALPTSMGLANSSINTAQQQVEEQKRAAAEAEKRQADLSDPSKYRAVPGKNGGYDFFAPDGSQVDIATLTKRTGTKAAEWLKDSKDPTDIQYLEDSKNLQDFMNAIVSKDKKKIKTYTDNSPQLNQYTNGKGGIHNLLQQFQQSYRRYYTPDWGALPGGPVVPAAQTGNTDQSAGL